MKGFNPRATFETYFRAMNWIHVALLIPLLGGIAPRLAADPLFAWEFDGKRAFVHLKAQCEMGPRIPGYAGHRKCSEYIAAQLQESSCTVQLQRFTAYNPLLKRNMPYENIVGFFDAPATRAIALSAHWDTRPHADQDRSEGNRRSPVPGANDGASGVAVLLELARIFKKNPPPVDVWFLCFDAEDSGVPNKVDRFCLGSKYFVSNRPADFAILVGVNLDMVGDKTLILPVERNSMTLAQDYVKDIWGLGVDNFPDVFQKKFSDGIYDDHVPFIQAGIPYLNVIDFVYKPWHTINDLPEQCSAESLDVVGKTIALWVFTALEKKSD